MSYGLKVWDASGILTVDISDRLCRLHSSHSGTSAYNRALSTDRPTVMVNRAIISVPGLRNDGTWFLTGVTLGVGYVYRGYYVYFDNDQVILDIMYSASVSKSIAYSFDVMRA